VTRQGLSQRLIHRVLLLCAVSLPFATLRVCAQDVVGDVYASDASVHGSVVLAGDGTRVLSGSTVAAGLTAATVKLARGGSLRVCPGTNVALSTAQSGRALALGFNSGAVELHYDLSSSADTLQTSDFRLLLAGPGTFHLAVSADRLGNTCVKPMAQNTSSVIVQELFGDATYQVKADESVVFRKGKVSDISRDVPPDCGCPALPEVKRAEAMPPTPTPAAPVPPRAEADARKPNLAASLEVAKPIETCKVVPPGSDAKTPTCAETPPAMALTPAPVEVESPFVFHADPAVPDPPVIANVRLSDRGRALAFQPLVLPPESTKVAYAKRESRKPQPSKGFMSRMKSFFAAMFK
jgi:hypothetical protein